VTIATRYRARDDSASLAAGPEHGEAWLSVSDTGVGMDDETKARIFEPFFTTKQEGMGTGIGLATVYAIVKQSGGSIHVDSAPGAGSQFHVFLPLIDQTPRVSGPRQAPAPIGGNEKILIVEDRAPLRLLTKRWLEADGYDVCEAVDGQDALAKFKEHGSSLDLLVTDVVMPVLSGRKLALAIREVAPDLPVIYMSGFDSEPYRDVSLATSDVFLQKPFTREELLTKVREVLDREAVR
jgi:two-component system, cell cycle sensor histidine kinase and response regulator CckA